MKKHLKIKTKYKLNIINYVIETLQTIYVKITINNFKNII